MQKFTKEQFKKFIDESVAAAELIALYWDGLKSIEADYNQDIEIRLAAREGLACFAKDVKDFNLDSYLPGNNLWNTYE